MRMCTLDLRIWHTCEHKYAMYPGIFFVYNYSVVASDASRRTAQANKPKHGSRRGRTGTFSELQGATRYITYACALLICFKHRHETRPWRRDMRH